MNKSILMSAVFAATALLTWNSNMTKVKAEEVNASAEISSNINMSENSIGGMSLVLNNYYDSILSETGISINNVSTTIFVDGEKLEAKDNTTFLFNRIGLANVIDYVNIRSEASTDSDIVGRLYRAAAVTILGSKGDFTKISSGKVTGYVATEYLLTGERAKTFADDNYTRYAQATCTTLNVRKGPGEDYDVAAKIAKGDKLEVVSVLDEWVQVKAASLSGKLYVNKSYVDFVYDFKYAKTLDQIKTDINCMVWPLPSDHKIYTYYGYRVAPTKGASTFHQGLDIGGAKGSNVVAVLAGKVIDTGYNSTSGNYVEIDHGNGAITRYLHNSKILVKEGQYVDQGEVISLVGSTGVSTGPHLHFSLILNGKSVDPYPYLKRVH